MTEYITKSIIQFPQSQQLLGRNTSSENDSKSDLKKLRDEEVRLRRELVGIEQKREKYQLNNKVNEIAFFKSVLEELLTVFENKPTFEMGSFKFATWSYSFGGNLFLPSYREDKRYDGGYSSAGVKGLDSFTHCLGLSDNDAFLFIQYLRLFTAGKYFDPAEHWNWMDECTDFRKDEPLQKLKEWFEERIKNSPYKITTWNTILEEARSPDGHGKNTRDYIITWQQDFMFREKT